MLWEQALSKRIHYGKFVAEAMFLEQPEDFSGLIRRGDAEGLMELITDARAETMVPQPSPKPLDHHRASHARRNRCVCGLVLHALSLTPCKQQCYDPRGGTRSPGIACSLSVDGLARLSAIPLECGVYRSQSASGYTVLASRPIASRQSMWLMRELLCPCLHCLNISPPLTQARVQADVSSC